MKYHWERLTLEEEEQIISNLQARMLNLTRFNEKKAKISPNKVIPNKTVDDATKNMTIINNILKKIR